MQAIRVHEGSASCGPVYVLIALETDMAQLMVVRASEVTEEAWNQAVMFCWAAGWVVRQDDPDIYIGESDTEIYMLVEADDNEAEMDERDEEASIHG